MDGTKKNKVGSRKHTIVVTNIGSDKNRHGREQIPDRIDSINLRKEFGDLHRSFNESHNSNSGSNDHENYSKRN